VLSEGRLVSCDRWAGGEVRSFNDVRAAIVAERVAESITRLWRRGREAQQGVVSSVCRVALSLVLLGIIVDAVVGCIASPSSAVASVALLCTCTPTTSSSYCTFIIELWNFNSHSQRNVVSLPNTNYDYLI